jgi:alanine adding enzyme
VFRANKLARTAAGAARLLLGKLPLKRSA